MNALNKDTTCQKIGISTATLYAWVADGTFPPPVKVGKRRSIWIESEVEEWLAARVAKRDATIAEKGISGYMVPVAGKGV